MKSIVTVLLLLSSSAGFAKGKVITKVYDCSKLESGTQFLYENSINLKTKEETQKLTNQESGEVKITRSTKKNVTANSVEYDFSEYGGFDAHVVMTETAKKENGKLSQRSLIALVSEAKTSYLHCIRKI
jgi:ribosome-interacting GTPase 1